MSDFLYDVFICHNSAEKGEVDTIASYLEAKGIRLWYDKFELRPGTDWQGFVEREWPRIQSIAVFLGGRGLGPGQAFELDTLLPKARPQTQFVVPILLPTFDEQRNQIPERLRGLIYVDFRKPENKPLEQLIWAISGENPNRKRSLGTYYRDIGGLDGEELRLALSAIIAKGHEPVGYPKQAREHLCGLFEDPEDAHNLIELYSGQSIAKASYHGHVTSRRREASTWSMDRLWPKAFGFPDDRRIIADLHNIVPAEFGANAKKSAGFFSDPVLDRETKELPIPPSRHHDVRGAIARSCLYMAVRYAGQDGEPRLELDEQRPVLGEPHIGSLRTLLYWNRLVDVSVAERRRNHAIMDIQGNRNPFVDLPELATRIWYPV